MAQYALAVDIGGTFTDAVLRHEDGRTWVDKTLTTYDDLLDGFFAVIDSVMSRAAITPRQVDDVVVHATTLVTNCVIEGKGAKTALLTTEGFSDVLYMRDESRSNIFDNQLEFVAPLVPRSLTFAVKERIRADGSVALSVDLDSVAKIVKQLKAEKVQSVAVCLMHAYKNDTHEIAVRDVIAECAPEIMISLSSEVAPQIREYPRTSTTAINAYTMPLIQPYLGGLSARMRQKGFVQSPLIMLSNGGVIGIDTAARYPVRMIESGPAAGTLAARYFSRELGLPNLLSFDMGGTTAKASFIREGEPLVTGSFEVNRRYRFQAGSGMPVTVPCIDIIEIGAGGGSIARTDGMGMLTVGPESAGSEPGPICYGRGGDQPTVTDANLVLGLLDPANFLAGTMPLDQEGSVRGMSRLGGQLGVDGTEAAIGIYKMVCESMSAAVRSHATDNALDWRNLALLAFGGAGPVHACYVGELLESSKVIFPPLASVLSAFGTLVSPVRLDLAQSYLQRLSELDWKAVGELRGNMIKQATDALFDAGCGPDGVIASFAGDMRYVGQQHELTIDLALAEFDRHDPCFVRDRFEAAYQRQYGVLLPGHEIEIVTWRLFARGQERRNDQILSSQNAVERRESRRRVHFPSGLMETPVLSRNTLRPLVTYQGPALIEEGNTTIVILPGWQFELDNSGCVIAVPMLTPPSSQLEVPKSLKERVT